MTAHFRSSTATPWLVKKIASFVFLLCLVISLLAVPLALCCGIYTLYYRPAEDFSLQPQSRRLEQIGTAATNSQGRLDSVADELEELGRVARALLEGEDALEGEEARPAENSTTPPENPQP